MTRSKGVSEGDVRLPGSISFPPAASSLRHWIGSIRRGLTLLKQCVCCTGHIVYIWRRVADRVVTLILGFPVGVDLDVAAHCSRSALKRYPQPAHHITHHGQQPGQARRRHSSSNSTGLVCTCRALSTQGEFPIFVENENEQAQRESETSRRYYLLTKLRCVWYARFCADVLAHNLPPPGPPCPPSLLSATELERRTLRALYLHHAWPRLSANTIISGHHHGAPGARVDQVVFIPGGTELLTVQGDKVVHWHIVNRPGLPWGLKHVGEWTPFEGVPCRLVKDVDVPGVIAVGPREPLG